MNAKKAKAIRAAMREHGMDPFEVQYKKTNKHNVFSKDILGNINGVAEVYTAVLFNCGRADYRRIKRAA